MNSDHASSQVPQPRSHNGGCTSRAWQHGLSAVLAFLAWQLSESDRVLFQHEREIHEPYLRSNYESVTKYTRLGVRFAGKVTTRMTDNVHKYSPSYRTIARLARI